MSPAPGCQTVSNSISRLLPLAFGSDRFDRNPLGEKGKGRPNDQTWIDFGTLSNHQKPFALALSVLQPCFLFQLAVDQVEIEIQIEAESELSWRLFATSRLLGCSISLGATDISIRNPEGTWTFSFPSVCLVDHAASQRFHHTAPAPALVPPNAHDAARLHYTPRTGSSLVAASTSTYSGRPRPSASAATYYLPYCLTGRTPPQV